VGCVGEGCLTQKEEGLDRRLAAARN